MLKNIRRFIPSLIFLTLCIAINATLDIFLNLKIKEVVDFTVQGQDFEFKRNILYIVAFILISLPGTIFYNYFKSFFIRNALVKMKQRYLKKVFNKNISEFRKDNNSLYMSSLTNDYDQIEKNFLEPIIDLIYSIINFAAGVILFSIVNPIIILIALGLMIVNLILSSISAKPLNKHNKQRSDLFASYTAYIKEVLSAFHIIKTNDLEEKVRKDFKEKSQLVQHKGFIIDKISSFVFAIQNANFSLTFYSLFGIVGYMAIDGVLTLGAVVLIINAIEKVIWPITNFSEALPKLFSVKSIFSRIEKTLKNHQEYEEQLDFDGFKDKIEIKNVSFSYEDQTVLDNISLSFEKGGKYLIVGPSGGGKSTVLRLLRKYFNPNDGEILIDGIPLKDVKKEQYFNHIANIEQNVFLFEDSIKNNLTLYKDYTDEEINDAIKKAGLTDFINELTDGINSMIYDNGKNISGGERSRLAIARGLLNKADIIFLDEAFASLDAEKAKAIEESILNLKGVTVINVSHVIFKEHQYDYDNVYIVKNKTVLTK